jgi:hypothetical protein
MTFARPEKSKTPEAARLRPARTPQYGARLRLSPKTAAIAVSTDSFATLHYAKLSDLTVSSKYV